MRELLSKYRIELIVVGTLLLLGMVVGVFLLRQRAAEPPKLSDSITPIITKTPESDLLTTTLRPETKELRVLNVTPDPAKGPYYNTQVFTVRFNDTVDASSLLVGMGERFPIKVMAGTEPTEIQIAPDDTWDVNHDYSVNIYPGSASVNGLVLKKQYEFIFHISVPEGIDGV